MMGRKVGSVNLKANDCWNRQRTSAANQVRETSVKASGARALYTK